MRGEDFFIFLHCMAFDLAKKWSVVLLGRYPEDEMVKHPTNGLSRQNQLQH
jgi:hypothetical protein